MQCNNGLADVVEMEDRCRKCAALVHIDASVSSASCGRKLAAHGSHSEAPAKKAQTLSTAMDVPVPSDDQGQEPNFQGMFQQLLTAMHGVQTDVASMKCEFGELKQQTSGTLSAFKAELQEDISRVESNLDNLTAEHAETKAGLSVLQTEVLTFKNSASQSARNAGASAVPRSASAPARGQFCPAEVYVQGFYDFDTDQGALSEEQVNTISGKLMTDVLAALKDQFQVECRFTPARRITFVTRSGGDCRKLRQQLVNAITKQELRITVKHGE